MPIIREEQKMDISEQKTIAYDFVRGAFEKALAEGKHGEEIVEEFVGNIRGRVPEMLYTDDQIRAFATAVVAQVKKDDAAEWERRMGM